MKREALAQGSVTSEGVGRYYDELDHIYRVHATRHVHHGLWIRGDETRTEAKQNVASWVADQLGLAPGDRCVDIGSGYGEMARYLSSTNRISVTAVTNSELQCAWAVQENRSESVDYRLGDWCRNELRGSAYDAGWAVESMEHMPDLDAALRQCRRVLKPGGRLLVLSWLASERAPRWQRIAFLEPTARQYRLAPLRTEAAIVRALSTAGFGQIRVSDLTRNVRRTWLPTAAGILQRLRSNASHV